MKNNTISQKFLDLPVIERADVLLLDAMKTFDVNANVLWPLMHMGSAYRYLRKDNKDIDATGGTNGKIICLKFSKIIFFPDIWSAEEKDDWGKQWVDHVFNPEKA